MNTVICSFKNCDNTFSYKSNKKYCSRTCKQKAHSLRDRNRIERSKKFLDANRDRKKRGYRRYKKGYCENCGFKPKHSCQLDVDHIDGNHDNNDIENLQTLCANCHRLKTYLNKDWKQKK